MPKELSKEAEMKILKATVEKLGDNSYTGKWLAAQLPLIEDDMKNDLEPMIAYTWQQIRRSNALITAREDGVTQDEKDVEEEWRKIMDVRDNVIDRVKATFDKEIAAIRNGETK